LFAPKLPWVKVITEAVGSVEPFTETVIGDIHALEAAVEGHGVAIRVQRGARTRSDYGHRATDATDCRKGVEASGNRRRC
jgi:hypothetical protein